MKLWSGRFEKNTDALVDKLNASISFDKRLYREDIEGSLAHARMLAAVGVLTAGEQEKIDTALRGILGDLETGALIFGTENEDIHMSVEAELTHRIGEDGKRLHTARSRNDQVALDVRLYLKRSLTDVRTLTLELISCLLSRAGDNLKTILPAYTHLQRAQPTTLAHYFMAYANMFRRDVLRLDDCLARMDESPLGSGALTGTTYPIDREMVAKELGFARITQNSLDGVSDRDFALEAMSAMSILMMHLSRFSEEIVLWCSWEFRFIELDDAYSTGSSIMPQKKNPDVAELVRGKTGRVYGDLFTLFTVMKALPLAYNKDMQEDKEPLFDALDTLSDCLPVFTAMIATMKVNAKNMRAAAGAGFINATDCADYLVKKGLPFRDAYTVTGKLVHYCIEQGKTLETLSLPEYRSFSGLFEADVFEAIALETCLNGRSVPGGPSEPSVLAQMAYIRDFLEGAHCK